MSFDFSMLTGSTFLANMRRNLDGFSSPYESAHLDVEDALALLSIAEGKSEDYPQMTHIHGDLNCTYNVSPMFYRAFQEAGADPETRGDREVGGIRLIHGCTGADMADALIVASEHMRDNPEIYEPMNPENGWGDYEGACRVIFTLASWAQRFPDAVFNVS